MSTTTSSSSTSLDSTYGCVFVACILTTALWGAATVQLYLYYSRNAERDSWRMKAYILLIWMLDTALQVIDVHSTYKTFVTNFDNPLGLVGFNVGRYSYAGVTLIVDVLVQFFFLRRVYRLSHGNLLVSIIGVVLILGRAGLLLAYFGKAYHFTLMTELGSLINIEHAINAVTAATDLYLASALVAYLWAARARSRADSIEDGVRMPMPVPRRKQRVESVVEKMIVYALGTSSLTALLAIIALITELASPDSFVYVLLDLLVPNIYVNSVLVALNTRRSFRTELDTPSNSEDITSPQQISTFHVAQRTDLSTLSTQDISTARDSIFITSVSIGMGGTDSNKGKQKKEIPAEDSHSDFLDHDGYGSGSERELTA